MYEKIKELCSNDNITISALERKMEFGKGTIDKWKVASPGIERIKKVADYFGVTVDFLLSGSDISKDAIVAAKKFDSLSDSQKQAVLQILDSYSCEGKE